MDRDFFTRDLFYTLVKINTREVPTLKKIRTANHNSTVSILATALAAASDVSKCYSDKHNDFYSCFILTEVK